MPVSLRGCTTVVILVVVAWIHELYAIKHLRYDDCLEDKREDIGTVLCCVVYDSCAQ